MLKKVLNLFGKAKVVDLDNDGKIETLRAEVEGVFSQFKRMHDKLGEVNGKLQSVVEDEKRIAEQATKRIIKAQSELQANEKLQEKVKDFIL